MSLDLNLTVMPFCITESEILIVENCETNLINIKNKKYVKG